jgi:hypothetical protein
MVEQAARGEHSAWALHVASCTIIRHYARSVISPRWRDKLTDALIEAHLTVRRQYHRCNPEIIDVGCAALQCLVVLWADLPEVRSRRDRGRVRDCVDAALFLRNILDCLRIAEDADERDSKRLPSATIIDFPAFANRELPTFSAEHEMTTGAD